MKIILAYPAQIITVNTNGKNYKRGKELNNISAVENHSLIIEEGLIKDIIPNSSTKISSGDKVIDVKDKVVLPGLIECHTHTAFAGSRSDEFRRRLSGESYEEIAKSGGGINSTVKAVRNSSVEELISLLIPRVNYFISQGITSLEIKSGYGLDYENELKLLQAINYIKDIFPIDIVPTFLGAHTFPPEFNNDHESYIELLTNKLIPYISLHKLAKYCDAFCESTAFSASEIERIFIKAKESGMGLKLHTEQFNNIGGIDLALKHSVTSADHLEVLEESKLNKLANSEIVCTLLPGVSFFLNYQYAPARKLIDNNAIIALATDYNPGSSHIANLNFIMSLAAIKTGMTIEETISAVTINAAKAIGLNEITGSIEINKQADFAVFDTYNYSDIVYNIGKNLNCMTIKKGEIIYSTILNNTDKTGID
ncbi:MAG: imidazolonepropionase [Ignavibacteria bacterium GWA2_35_9]|nr:MAG: imidazolonepropionase [Ignavibacteria bacterium GWA2_35_9]